MTTEMPEYNPGDYYADSGGTMEYDGFNFIAESNAVFRWSVPFDVVGFVLGVAILGLSGIRHKVKFNLGPRIFTINMAVIDIIHSVTSFLIDYPAVNTKFGSFLDRVGASTFIFQYGDVIRSFDMLLFNCTLVPMMVMSIVACYTTQRITQKGSALRFAAIVGVADTVPLLIQVINVATNSGSGAAWASLLFIITTFVLYFVQLALTIGALVVLHRKSKTFSNVSAKEDGKVNKNLIRVLLFAAGPCLLQVPFAIYLILQQARDSSVFYQRMSLGVRLIFAMKPTIDAIFTLLFLGEYRQYPINCYKWLREKLIGKKGQSTTRVTEFQRRAPAAHNAIPSTVSGHINNLREGTRPSGIGRSSSLPVKITTISA